MGILDLFSLKGKDALVPGLAQGLGSGIAIALAQAGANVTLHGDDVGIAPDLAGRRSRKLGVLERRPEWPA